MALLYADIRAYCSHVKMYGKRARLLSSHPQLSISFHFILMPAQVQLGESKTYRRQELPVVGAANT